MKHTFLRQQEQINEEKEEIIAIATSDFDFFILNVIEKQVVCKIENAHNQDITQILVLTDFYTRLTFVTLSLDGEMKLWSDEGQLESYSLVDGG